MKAVQLLEYGEPARVLAVRDAPLPKPSRGEVRVRMLASPINPSDLLFVRGLYPHDPAAFPAPVGFEGAGRVDALGPDVQGLAAGQRVAFMNRNGGNWAEYAVVPAQDLNPVPDDVPDEQAACLCINPPTALLMLRRVLAIPRGEWLLQSAASSELGRMIIRLARHDGIRTVNVVRRREAVAELQRLGADAVVVSMDGPIDEQVREIVGPQGVKYAIDPVVGETGTQVFQALGEEGRMLVYGSLTGEPMRLGVEPRLILGGHRIVEVFLAPYWMARLDEASRRHLFDQLFSLWREGIFATSIGREFSLDDIGSAVVEAERTGRQGKVLLDTSRA
jgi:NADPH:quinone reductase-like Zn-dependent oxidoreductase